MDEKKKEEMVTIKEAAHIAKRDRRTIFRWIAEKKLTVHRNPAGMPLVARSELLVSMRESIYGTPIAHDPSMG